MRWRAKRTSKRTCMNCEALNQADEGSTAVALRGLGFAGCEKSGRAMR